MTLKKLFATMSVWIVAVTGLHLWLNFDWESYLNESRPEAERKLNVAYIPVT
ncbi:MAG: hypothetical protein ABI867_07025 [Kofleriaceae bacterium]